MARLLGSCLRAVDSMGYVCAAGYRRIAEDLRQQITSGELASGQRVPSEAELMRRYGVSRGTARQGLALLEPLAW